MIELTMIQPSPVYQITPSAALDVLHHQLVNQATPSATLCGGGSGLVYETRFSLFASTVYILITVPP